MLLQGEGRYHEQFFYEEDGRAGGGGERSRLVSYSRIFSTISRPRNDGPLTNHQVHLEFRERRLSAVCTSATIPGAMRGLF